MIQKLSFIEITKVEAAMNSFRIYVCDDEPKTTHFGDTAFGIIRVPEINYGYIF